MQDMTGNLFNQLMGYVDIKPFNDIKKMIEDYYETGNDIGDKFVVLSSGSHGYTVNITSTPDDGVILRVYPNPAVKSGDFGSENVEREIRLPSITSPSPK